MSKKQLSPVEIIKQKSHGLRGTLQESLNDEITGSIREDDQSVIKFHGMYQQDDRDRRAERAEKETGSFIFLYGTPAPARRLT